MKEKISIIIPVYNSGKHLSKCLDSIINQTYKNLEIILIDDGSTDDTTLICDNYATSDPRIVVKHIKNSGVANARNIGLSISTGDYIGFVDADDYIEINMFEKMMDALLKDKTEIVVCNFYKENENGTIIDSDSSENLVFDRIDYPTKMFFNHYIQGYLWNKLYSRNLIYHKDKLSISFDKDIFNLSDDLFNFKIFEDNKKFKVSYIDKRLYHYVQHNDSITYQNFSLKKLSGLVVKMKEIEILEKNNLDSNYLKIDFCALFLRNKYLMKKFGLKENDLYYKLLEINKLYKRDIKIKDVNAKLKIKYLIVKFFPYAYQIKLILLKEKK